MKNPPQFLHVPKLLFFFSLAVSQPNSQDSQFWNYTLLLIFFLLILSQLMQQGVNKWWCSMQLWHKTHIAQFLSRLFFIECNLPCLKAHSSYWSPTLNSSISSLPIRSMFIFEHNCLLSRLIGPIGGTLADWASLFCFLFFEMPCWLCL